MENRPIKILFLTAVADELGSATIEQLSQLCDIRFTGVGKLCSFEATLEALANGNYTHIINVGTCGSFHHAGATLLYPSRVVQGDIYIASDFATEPIELHTGDEQTSIVSSDNFIGADTAPSQVELLKPYDCMDMESYAIMRAIYFHSKHSNSPLPEVHMIKIVSDAADGTLEEWKERIERLQSKLGDATLAKIEAIRNNQ